MRRYILRLLSSICLLGILCLSPACTKRQEAEPPSTRLSPTEGMLCALSDTGVEAMVPAKKPESDKQVGVFYFITGGTGNYGNKNYDNTEILKNIDLTGKTMLTIDEWRAAGGGDSYTAHWWGRPLFGYYDQDDVWLVTRHVEMLTAAGVDFIVIDQTNGVQEGYIKRINLLFEVLYKYYQQGFDVPQVAMMAYDDTNLTVERLYKQFYSKHPEYRPLFYHWNGHEKPVIFDNINSFSKTADFMIDPEEKLASYSQEVRDFFEIRDVAFPHETTNPVGSGIGFLYLDCRDVPQLVVDEADGGYSFYCVALSEIREGGASRQWFGDNKTRSRNYDGSKNLHWHGQEDAYLYGYNFSWEFEDAIKKDPDMIFITGWNEWTAHVSVNDSTKAIGFMDCADINNSRDIEPMSGGYGDNYYIQMCHFISRFKYGSLETESAPSVTIDTAGDFSQWDNDAILTFEDFVGDHIGRNKASAGDKSVIYTTKEGVNDLKTVKVASDSKNVFFYLEGVEAFELGKDASLTLFVDTGSKNVWYGYSHRVVILGESAVLEAYKDGLWENCGEIPLRISENKIMLSISVEELGLGGEDFVIAFKWADSLGADFDIWDFYIEGDCAPYGRMNFFYKGK